jgi:predicted RNase H-like HicB family nuclease
MGVVVKMSFGLDFDPLKEFLEQFTGDAPAIVGGVAAYGEPAAYALVWEYGNTRQTKQGPRTVRGINPNGESVWLSSQAPVGYVAVYENDYWAAINSRLDGVSFDGASIEEWATEMKSAVALATADIAEIIREHAPVGIGSKHRAGGALQGSIEAMSPDDPDLQGFDTSSDIFISAGTTFMGVGE